MVRALRWTVLVLATVVAVGIFLQAFFIAAYVRGAGEDALDAHGGLGFVVHSIEVVVFLAAIGAFWRRWVDIGLAAALAALGTAQVSLAEGDRWVGGLHGLFALVLLVLATIIAHRAMRALGLGHRRAPGAA